MGYFTRVLSRLDTVPELEELEEVLLREHPGCRLEIEETDEDGVWESLLLTTVDGIEIAALTRNPVFDGSTGQDEIADLLEDACDARPESALRWLEDFMEQVQTVYCFQHLSGWETEEGSAALHALRHTLWARGEAILQADHEGFTNEEGYHILWQFADTVSGSWNMAVLQDETWRNFSMDLGDQEHREAFWAGEVPSDLEGLQRRR